MTALDDQAVQRLQQVLREPDLEGTPYRFIGLLGRGGMGSVYEVEEPALHRRLALKVLDLPGEDAERMLRREAEVLAALEHPGVVPIHAVGTLPDGRAFYAMKRVTGTRLDAASVRAAPLTERLRTFLKLAETVAFAHAHCIVHRDLKPQNVMLGPFGEVLLMDWGWLGAPAGATSRQVTRSEPRATWLRSRRSGRRAPVVHAPTSTRWAPSSPSCSKRTDRSARRRRSARSSHGQCPSARRTATRTSRHWPRTWRATSPVRR